MKWREEWKSLLLLGGTFLVLFYLPVETKRFENGLLEAFHLAHWYAREHVLLCLVPAFFIAGAITTFVNRASVMKYLGAQANPFLSYGVASVAGSVLAVCSCTVLPIFGGIYRRGAGLGPAIAFLYSGPAVNVLALILTARVLGIELGIARLAGSVGFSVLIGLLMAFLFRREEKQTPSSTPTVEVNRPLWQNATLLATMVGILVFLNWAKPVEEGGFWSTLYSVRWKVVGGLAILLGAELVGWLRAEKKHLGVVGLLILLSALKFPEKPMIPYLIGVGGFSVAAGSGKGEVQEWLSASWEFAKQTLPLLFIGVLVAGSLLGRPGWEGWIPSEWVIKTVGHNSLTSNLMASIFGAFMYFATLTEVPILQGLLGNGMAKGPALALLLSGPALSLPSMLVIRRFIGTRKTLAYVSLVAVFSALTGLFYGTFI